jgi:hypothetical protein
MSVPTSESTGDTAWRSLPLPALAFRLAHLAWGVLELGALAHVWWCALRPSRSRYLPVSVAFLLAQGAALVAGRGNCPMGPVQRSLGDPVPMFELVLPPRAAKAAIPVLTGVALAGIAAALWRRPTS